MCSIYWSNKWNKQYTSKWYKNLDEVMPIFNLFEYNNYSKILGSLLKLYESKMNKKTYLKSLESLPLISKFANNTNNADSSLEIAVPLK